MIPSKYIKGRGAQINPTNPYDKWIYDPIPDLESDHKTEVIPVKAKRILNKINSPDIGMAYSLNPYQGCEHGCIYCYARNTHPYWGYSAGLDFEQKILVKKDAAKILEEHIRKTNWEAVPIMLSGNTDCYQPIEKQLEITRNILEVLWRYRHPVGIITKNSLVLRDLDLLIPLAQLRLVKVSISLTTLDDDLRRFMEPRTASVSNRLNTIKRLSEEGIPVNVMLAPIIPGLTEHELLPMAEQVARLGAKSIAYTMVRLNGDVAEIFSDWIQKNRPNQAEKILNKIRACHGGQLSDSRFGVRMRGEGKIANMINQQYQLAKRLFFADQKMPAYNLEIHRRYKSPQIRLFE